MEKALLLLIVFYVLKNWASKKHKNFKLYTVEKVWLIHCKKRMNNLNSNLEWIPFEKSMNYETWNWTVVYNSVTL